MSKPVPACVFVVVLVSAGVMRPAIAHAQPTPTAAFERGKAVAQDVVQELSNQGIGTLADAKNGYVIAEGDSWFAYPGLDVLSALAGRLGDGSKYGVYSAAHPGDTVESMAYERQQLEAFAEEFRKVADAKRASQVKAILLSGGGNDIAGSEFRMVLNHAMSQFGQTAPLDDTMADALLNRVVRDLASLIGTAQFFAQTYLSRTDIPVLVHGYAPPVPDGRPFLFGWFLPGPWLQPGFSAKGYVTEDPQDLSRNTRVMADLIRRFNTRVAALATTIPGVRYVDATTVLTNDLARYRNDWANELHPRDAAFIRVAEEFHKKIRQP